MTAARDGQTHWALRQLHVQRLQEKIRLSRLERGWIAQMMIDQGVPLETLVEDVNKVQREAGDERRETIANLQECRREWQQYLRDGGDPNAFQPIV